jgi:gluconate kinase
MDADVLRRHLDQVEEQVRRGRRLIDDQRLCIARLEAKGKDASSAREFLESLLHVQALHEAHRDRLRRQVTP